MSVQPSTENDYTPLTGPERRALGCECTRLDNVWHHKGGCPVPAVEKMLGERIEGNDRMHRALSQAKDREALALRHRLGVIRAALDGLAAECEGKIIVPGVDVVRRSRTVVAVIDSPLNIPPGVTE